MSGGVDIQFILPESERLLSILFFQQPGILEWDLDGRALEEAVAERVDVAFLGMRRGCQLGGASSGEMRIHLDVTYQVMMPVLAHQCPFHPLFDCCPIPADGADVDEKSRVRIDPPCIDDV